MSLDIASNHYNFLGVQTNASDSDIKKAYRKLALKLHPDKNIDDPNQGELFKHLQTAYDTLIDKDKRSVYDNDHISSASADSFANHSTFRPSQYSSMRPSNRAPPRNPPRNPYHHSPNHNPRPSAARYPPTDRSYSNEYSQASGNNFSDFFNHYSTSGFDRDDGFFDHGAHSFGNLYGRFFNSPHSFMSSNYFFPRGRNDGQKSTGHGQSYGSTPSSNTNPHSTNESSRPSKNRRSHVHEQPSASRPPERSPNFKSSKPDWTESSSAYSYVNSHAPDTSARPSNPQPEPHSSSYTNSFMPDTGPREKVRFNMYSGSKPSQRSQPEPTKPEEKFYSRFRTPNFQDYFADSDDNDDDIEEISMPWTTGEQNSAEHEQTSPKQETSHHTSSHSRFESVPQGVPIIDLTDETIEPSDQEMNSRDMEGDEESVYMSAMSGDDSNHKPGERASFEVDQTEAAPSAHNVSQEADPIQSEDATPETMDEDVSLRAHLEDPLKVHSDTPLDTPLEDIPNLTPDEDNSGSKSPKRALDAHEGEAEETNSGTSKKPKISAYENLNELYSMPPFNADVNFSMDDMFETVPQDASHGKPTRKKNQRGNSRSKRSVAGGIDASYVPLKPTTPRAAQTTTFSPVNTTTYQTFNPQNNHEGHENIDVSMSPKVEKSPDILVYDLHDSEAVLHLRPPTPPDFPRNSEISRETNIKTFENAMTDYMTKWNTYSNTMLAYHNERQKADLGYNLHLLTDKTLSRKYISALRQDAFVKESWKASLDVHRAVIENFLSIKTLIEPNKPNVPNVL